MKVCRRKGLLLLMAMLMLGVGACGMNKEDKSQSSNTAGVQNEIDGLNRDDTPEDVTGEVIAPSEEAKEPEEVLTPSEEQKEPEKAGIETLSYGRITTGYTKLKTKHLEFSIPLKVYIPDDLVENVDIVTSAMEIVSGMKFEGNSKYSSELLSVHVEKMWGTERELGNAYAFEGNVYVSPGDLVDLSALIHECSHALQYNQSGWSYCEWAMEGISTYTTYKTLAYIEQHYPELVPIAGFMDQSFNDLVITDYDELYKHPMEYWVENTFEYSWNGNYPIGFRFMWYLDEVYGDYTKWIYEYEKLNPFYLSDKVSDDVEPEDQIKIFKTVYGEDVFEDFYHWLEMNRKRFVSGTVADLSHAEKIQVYPTCAYSRIFYSLQHSFRYHDLFVDIAVGREYLNEYKGKNTQDMVLNVSVGTVLELYDAEGNLLRKEGPTQKDQPIPLDGASSLKLVGSGTLTHFVIEGFENYK